MRRRPDSRPRLRALRATATRPQDPGPFADPAPFPVAAKSEGDEPDGADPTAPDDGWVPGDDLDPPPAAVGEPAARRQRRGPWGRLAARWVPESLRDSRIDPGRRAATILVAVAALAAVIAAVGVWRSKPEPRPVTAVALPAAPSATSAASAAVAIPARPSSSGATSEPLVVAVTGWVARPGLVTVRAGARVADALTAAGGARPGADLSGLNLAERLSDGESIVVGAPGTTTVPPTRSGVTGGEESASATAGTDVVDLNAADAAALDALPGVGPVTAANIVAWRQRNGRFTSIQQLQEIPGIGPAKFAQLAPHLRI